MLVREDPGQDKGGGILMKHIFFHTGSLHKMMWLLKISSDDDFVHCSVYLTPKEAKKLFKLMKKAGFK